MEDEIKNPLLRAIWEQCELNPDCLVSPDQADEMRADIREAIAELEQAANYCEAKGNAMRSRLDGKIENAQRFEGACDTIYKRLRFLQW
jgi:hypothetical protein